ncbi:type 1 glutamine amidotransferase [Streptomyces sp. SID8361]|nr:type 1 glutamine amidotransferase [Streptomyces sp. SID8361]
MPTLLVVQPDPSDPLDQFGPWLAEAAVSWRVVRPFADDAIPADLDEDGLLVLGGDMSSLDDVDHPWLEDIRVLYRRAAELRRPTLGICLGAQLMAQAFGGTVRPGDNGVETGVVRVRWRDEAANDPLLHNFDAPFPVGAMHGDMIAGLPPGASWLGMSPMYAHQAFRVGECAWGVQFHPEIGAETYNQWVDMYDGSDPVAKERLELGRRDFAQMEADVLTGTVAVARRFADLLRLTALTRRGSEDVRSSAD